MSSLAEFAERELRLAGLFDDGSDYDGMLGEAVLELVKVFAEQGHSGFSAGRTVALFRKVAMYEPLMPLTGADDEWNEVGTGIYQNNRCSHVFKENGRAYDSEGIIFRDPDGATYTSRDSRVDVTFPYVPTRKIVDRAAS